MDKIKVLNLYAGIGGNRKLWENVEVTAVENNKDIANIYSKYFPQDKVIVGDAHQYLLEHFREFDFIWSSPPCPSHSKARYLASKGGDYLPIYPSFDLWQEIIFLQKFCDVPWVVENVKTYYDPIIKPTVTLSKHYIWSNFRIPVKRFPSKRYHFNAVEELQAEKGFDLSGIDAHGIRKDVLLKNCVKPELGLYVFNCAFKKKQSTLLDTSIPPAPKEAGILEEVL